MKIKAELTEEEVLLAVDEYVRKNCAPALEHARLIIEVGSRRGKYFAIIETNEVKP